MRRFTVILICFVMLLLALTLPLRLALSWIQAERWLSADRVAGTVWNGVLHGGWLGHMPLGDVQVALDPFSLLSGRMGFRFAADGALAGSGVAVLGRGDRALQADTMRFPLQVLSTSLPLRGEMQLSEVDVVFDGRVCHSARGSVLIRQVRLTQGNMRLPAEFQLRGVLGCGGGDVIMRLAGRSGGIVLRSTVRIAADGAYRMENHLTGLGRAGDGLAAEAGFLPEAGGHARVDRGRLAL